MLKKAIAVFLSFNFIFTQCVFAQGVVQLNLGNYLRTVGSSVAVDKFRPLHMRYFSYDVATDEFEMLLDKGDFKDIKEDELTDKSKVLMDYFLIGLALPNDKFWVNLRPDAEDQIIDPGLEKTDIGKIMLEADLQLKKDTASFTSPQTPEGKVYWDKLYKKAGELFGTEDITIPTITRPWIVPGEVILRESEGSAYIYKANMKVMLEHDYLRSQSSDPNYKPLTSNYSFSDPRMKELNEYSTQLIRELIIPKLTKEVNSSKRYASLRQVFFSLVLARWFKDNFTGKSGTYAQMIDSHNLKNLVSQEPWAKTTYFDAYKESFAKGEYNLKEHVYTSTGQVVRSYVSGGIFMNVVHAGYKVIRYGKGYLIPLLFAAGMFPLVSQAGTYSAEGFKPLTSSVVKSLKNDEIEAGLTRKGFTYGFFNYFITLGGQEYLLPKNSPEREGRQGHVYSVPVLNGKIIISGISDHKAVVEVVDSRGQLVGKISYGIKDGKETVTVDYGGEPDGQKKITDAFDGLRLSLGQEFEEKVVKNLASQNGINYKAIDDLFWRQDRGAARSADGTPPVSIKFDIFVGRPATIVIEKDGNEYGLSIAFTATKSSLDIHFDSEGVDVNPDLNPEDIGGAYTLENLFSKLGEELRGKSKSSSSVATKDELFKTVDEVLIDLHSEADKIRKDKLSGELANNLGPEMSEAKKEIEKIEIAIENLETFKQYIKNNFGGKYLYGSIEEFLSMAQQWDREINNDVYARLLKRWALRQDVQEMRKIISSIQMVLGAMYKESLEDETLRPFFEGRPSSYSGLESYLKLLSKQLWGSDIMFNINWTKLDKEVGDLIKVIADRNFKNKFDAELKLLKKFRSEMRSSGKKSISTESPQIGKPESSSSAGVVLNDELESLKKIAGAVGKENSVSSGITQNSLERYINPQQIMKGIVEELTKNHTLPNDALSATGSAGAQELLRALQQDVSLTDLAKTLETALNTLKSEGSLSTFPYKYSWSGLFMESAGDNIHNVLLRIEDSKIFPESGKKSFYELAAIEQEICLNILKIALEQLTLSKNVPLEQVYAIAFALSDSFQKRIQLGLPQYGIVVSEAYPGGLKVKITVPRDGAEYLIEKVIPSNDTTFVEFMKKLSRLMYDIREDGSGDSEYGGAKETIKTRLREFSDYLLQVSSSSLDVEDPVGGIDFRTMNYLTQPMGNFNDLRFMLPALSSSALESIDLDKELESLRNMVKAGMVPSGERIKEYLAACFQKGKIEEQQDNLLLCLVEVYRLLEEENIESAPELREAIVIADSGRFVVQAKENISLN